MKQLRNFLRQYPRLTGVLIGFTLGMFVVAGNNHWAQMTVSEYRTIAKKREARYEELLAKSKTTIDSLSKMNESLQKHTRKVKITKPDGTITESEDTESSSQTATEVAVRTEIESEYNLKIQKMTEIHQTEINKLTNRKLRLGLGYNTDFNYYFHGSYNVWGPVSIGGGVTSGGLLMFDVGINL